jgi:hypothetical protein
VGSGGFGWGSGVFLLILAGSGEFWWILVDSGGFCWTLVGV